MAEMTKEAKAKLREIGKKKRQQTRLLKDIEPLHLQVTCDRVDEEGIDCEFPVNPSYDDGVVYVGYLKYATPAQIEALVNRIPSRIHTILGGRPGQANRDVRVFNLKYLRKVMGFLVTTPDKYISGCWYRP